MILHDSTNDAGDGFAADFTTSEGRWPRLTLSGIDGEVVVFGVGELEALLDLTCKALERARKLGPADAARAA